MKPVRLMCVWGAAVCTLGAQAPTAAPQSTRVLVVDAGTLAPLAGASLTLPDVTRSTLRPGAAAVTDGSGVATLRSARTRRPVVIVRAPGYEPSMATPIDLVTPRSRPWQIRLRRLATVFGTVVDMSDTPVAGAVVGLAMNTHVRELIRQDRLVDAAVVTDREGRYRLHAPPGIPISIVARAAGRAPSREPHLQLSAGETRGGVVVRLHAGDALTCRVSSGDAGPIDGASITIQPAEARDDTTGMASDFVCRTDRSGRCAIGGIPAGGYLLTARHAAFALYERRDVVLPPPAADNPCEIVLLPSAALSGVIVGTDGLPIAGASVVGTTSSSIQLEATSDSDGQFELRGAAPGQSLTIVASSDGHAPGRTVAAAPSTTVRIVLRRTGTLRGRVVSLLNHGGLQSFAVEFSRRRQTPFRQNTPGMRVFEAADGRFEWEGLPPGTWSVTARAEGFQPTQLVGVEIQPGEDQEVLFVMRPGQALSGQVFSVGDRIPVPYATVTYHDANAATPFDHERLEMPATVLTDAEGRFLLQELAAGKVSITVRATGYAEARRDIVLPTSGTLGIPLHRGGTITGTVYSARGSPLMELVTVELGSLDTETAVGLPTDQNGQFKFEALEPGRYRVSAVAPDGRTASTEVRLDADERHQTVSLTLEDGVSIRGAVTGTSRGERNGITVTAFIDGELAASVAVRPDGRYDIAGLGAGIVKLTASTALGRELSRTLDLRSSTTGHVDFEFPPLRSRILGRITRGGEPVNFAAVDAVPVAEEMTKGEGETFQDGRYVIEGLNEGEYVVHVGMVAGVMNGTSRTVFVSGDTVVDVELPDLSVAGRVVEFPAGRPIPSATVQLRAVTSAGAPFTAKVQTDDAGLFIIRGLLDSDYRVTVFKQGFRVTAQSLVVRPGRDDLAVDMIASDSDVIRVRERPSGRSLRLARVHVEDGGGHTMLTVPLDTSGVGEVPRVSAGAYDMTISSPGYAPVRVRQVVPGDPRLDIALSPAGSLRIEASPAFVGRKAVLFDANGDSRELTLSETLSVADLAAGPCRLVLRAEHGEQVFGGVVASDRTNVLQLK